MPAYFSHSYRDVPINTYFSGLLRDAGVTLRADQKTDVWCVAKLERYLFEMEGFVSIIPRRLTADDAIAYSPYIGRELMLARRAQAPSLVFVDGQVLDLHQKDFPASAIPFFHDAPETERAAHVEAISRFHALLAHGARPPRQYVKKRATIVANREPILRDAASHVAAILRAERYKTSVKHATKIEAAFDDIDVFESILSSELCVFVLGNDPSASDVYLAMAHAHCIPSVRLRHDPAAATLDPDLAGVVRWRSSTELKGQFLKVFENYRAAFEEPAGEADLRRLATPPPLGAEWDPADPSGLLDHIQPEAVRYRTQSAIRSHESVAPSPARSHSLCRSLYEGVKQSDFYHTADAQLSLGQRVKIRPPEELEKVNCGTTIDFACFFASLLENVGERPLVCVARGSRGVHALAGYLAPGAPAAVRALDLSELRQALTTRAIVLFEATGAAECREGTTGAETEAERRQDGGQRKLSFDTATEAGGRFIMQTGVELLHAIDVSRLRPRP